MQGNDLARWSVDKSVFAALDKVQLSRVVPVLSGAQADLSQAYGERRETPAVYSEISGLKGDACDAWKSAPEGQLYDADEDAMREFATWMPERAGRAADLEAHGWPAGKTFGELSPAQRSAAVKRAAGQLQAELTVNADAIGQALDEAEDPGSGFAPGQSYYEIAPASGPEAFSTKRNPTCISIGTAEHNAREYSRDGRAYVIEHVDADGKRSKVAEFRSGRKVREPRR